MTAGHGFISSQRMGLEVFNSHRRGGRLAIQPPCSGRASDPTEGRSSPWRTSRAPGRWLVGLLGHDQDGPMPRSRTSAGVMPVPKSRRATLKASVPSNSNEQLLVVEHQFRPTSSTRQPWRHPGHQSGPGTVSGWRPSRRRRSGVARSVLAGSPNRAPVHHRTSTGRQLRSPGRGPPDAARDSADVAVDRIAANPESLDALDVYCATGSVRRAADLLHLHHSSVARRLEQLGRGLRLELSEPTGLIRARLALTAWRLVNDFGGENW
jgi:hypothetical protein